MLGISKIHYIYVIICTVIYIYIYICDYKHTLRLYFCIILYPTVQYSSLHYIQNDNEYNIYIYVCDMSLRHFGQNVKRSRPRKSISHRLQTKMQEHHLLLTNFRVSLQKTVSCFKKDMTINTPTQNQDTIHKKVKVP